MILTEEQKFELIKIILECAKERQKECNHLDIGIYVSDIFNKLTKII